MSNMGQIKRYTSYDDDRVTVGRNGKFVQYDDYKRLHRSMAEIRKERDVLIRRVDELELALLYYADEGHFKNGDVPGHIYALDDAGHIARNALGIDQKEVDRRVLANYYTE